MVYIASDTRLTDHPAQGDAASIAGLRTLHANNHGIDSTYKLIGYRTTWRTRHFADIHWHPKVLAARATRQARVVLVVSHVHENTAIVLNAKQLNDFSGGHFKDWRRWLSFSTTAMALRFEYVNCVDTHCRCNVDVCSSKEHALRPRNDSLEPLPERREFVLFVGLQWQHGVVMDARFLDVRQLRKKEAEVHDIFLSVA
jgi:hypothetical protein